MAKVQKQKITDLVGREVELSIPVQKVVAIGPGALRLVTYAEGASMVVEIEEAYNGVRGNGHLTMYCLCDRFNLQI